jgi:hypothetical protein
MKKALIAFLLIAGTVGLGMARYAKATYTSGAAQRIAAASAAIHGRTQVQIDEQQLKNDNLAAELAALQGKHYDKTIINAARQQLLTDETASEKATAAEEATAPEDTATEWTEVGIGIGCIGLAVLLAQIGRKPLKDNQAIVEAR